MYLGVFVMTYLKALSIDHANINVKNLEESVIFYSTLFGFELKKKQPEQNSKIIGNDMVKLCLYEDPDQVYTKGINHIGFHIENFDEIVEKCKEMNICMPYGVIEWESSRSVYIIDPNGYELEMSEIQGGGL